MDGKIFAAKSREDSVPEDSERMFVIFIAGDDYKRLYIYMYAPLLFI